MEIFIVIIISIWRIAVTFYSAAHEGAASLGNVELVIWPFIDDHRREKPHVINRLFDTVKLYIHDLI